MTEFEAAIAAVISALEPGDITTYGEVAAAAGYPGAARAVGTFLRNSDGYPWWRVVGAGGHIRNPDPARQIRLLTDEGALIVNGRVVRAG